MSQPALRGIFPACVTPFRDGCVDVEGILHNLTLWNQTGLSGYLFLGSTGEFVHLSEVERDTVVEAAREHTPPDRLLVVGSGALTTEQSLRFTRRAAELGADAALVITPFYYKGVMKGQTLVSHFSAIADASSIPILLYNVPPFTGINMAVETVARLALHPNIVGIKDSAGDVGQVAEIVRLTPDDFAVFTGGARVLYPCLCVGAVGGMMAVANVAPDLCVSIQTLVEQGDHAGARQCQMELTAVEKAVRPYGIPGYKATLDLLGYRGGSPRRPLLPLSGTDRDVIRDALSLTNVGLQAVQGAL